MWPPATHTTPIPESLWFHCESIAWHLLASGNICTRWHYNVSATWGPHLPTTYIPRGPWWRHRRAQSAGRSRHLQEQPCEQCQQIFGSQSTSGSVDYATPWVKSLARQVKQTPFALRFLIAKFPTGMRVMKHRQCNSCRTPSWNLDKLRNQPLVVFKKRSEWTSGLQEMLKIHYNMRKDPGPCISWLCPNCSPGGGWGRMTPCSPMTRGNF